MLEGKSFLEWVKSYTNASRESGHSFVIKIQPGAGRAPNSGHRKVFHSDWSHCVCRIGAVDDPYSVLGI